MLISHQFYTASGKEPETCDSEIRMVGGIENVDTAVLEPFDYAALGHIHKVQKIGKEQYRYCGTPLPYSVSEAETEKSITVVELGEKGSSPKISRLPLKPLRQVRKLTLPDGTVFPEKKTGTDAKILEIVGLTREQFTQTVMIAQGEFLKLLYTKSDERKQIFSKLFQTGAYWGIQERLRRRSAAMDFRIEENERAMEQEQARIIYPEGVETEEEKPALEDVVEFAREKEKEFEKLLKEQQKELERISGEIKSAEDTELLFGNLEKARAKGQKLKEQEPEDNSRKEQIVAAKKAVKASGEEEKYNSKQQELENSRKEEKKLTQQIEGAGIKYQQRETLLRDREKTLHSEEEEVKRNIHRIEESLPDYEKLTIAAEKEREAKSHYAEAEMCYHKMLSRKMGQVELFIRQEQEQKQAREALGEKQRLAEAAAQQYDKKYKLLLKGQAGILAEHLEEGTPCPVCGSTHHPKPAERSGNAVSEEDVERAKQKKKQLEKEEKQAQKAVEAALEKAGFADIAAYRAVKLSERSIEALEKKCREYGEQCQNNAGEMKSLEKTVAGKERVDITALKLCQKEAERRRKETERQRLAMHTAYETDHAVLENSRRYIEEAEKLKEQDAVVKSLYKTASGRLSGSAKIDFETYIQRQYFEQIIREANKRLLVMSNRQFMLKLKEESSAGKKSNEGLDLSVYSLVTDSERDVKTLSGGEAFLAALSMALGLSDIATRNAGAIHMDMMFIDEGFGSLDVQARTHAIEVLNELAGNHRMIGIISHVTELKEQIDRKLVVTRSDKGSKAAWSEE